MKITLTQTGGLMGRSKTAEADWAGTEGEFEDLVRKIKAKKDALSKDGYSYYIHAGKEGKEIPVSIQHIPAELEELFDSLFKNLRVSD